MDFEKKEKIEVDGFVSSGTQFDLEAKLMEDNRSAIFGIVKDSYGEPIRDAVVKLIEVDFKCGKEERKPVSHTFTDCDGEFVFGPLCPDRKYELQIWVNKVKHVKVCAKCHREGKCLKGVNMKECDCFINCKDECKKNDKKEYEKDCK